GGMYLVMEVNTAKLLERLVKDPDPVFFETLNEAAKESSEGDANVVSVLAAKLQEKGVRLSRYFGSIREDDSEIISRLEEQESDAVTRAIEIISNRVNQYGVSEPSIQKQGSRRIIVELPGVAKEEEAKRLLQGRALLEFKIVKDPDFTIPIMNKIDEVLAGTSVLEDSSEVEEDSSLIAENDTTATEDLTQEEFAEQHPFYSVALINPQSEVADAFVRESDKAKLENYLQRPEVKKIIPDNVEFVFSAKAEPVQEGENVYRMILVNKTPELTGGVITDAVSTIDPQTTAPIVTFEMDAEGSREWARITGSNAGKRLAIVLDGMFYSAPNIRGKITGGRSQIEGIPDLDEAKLLEIVLKAGALPAPIDIIEERTVGPSLGQDSISQGFNSTLIGFMLVVIFMIFYYKTTGAISDLALFFTVVFIMGILAGFQATLTLPGIAGIILTIGMAVDANVIIFERIREELLTGKTVKASIDSGFSNSYSAIFDANITTFFTGIILYQFGSGPVQGFALTLMIGIASSLFAALVVTRLVLDMMAAQGKKLNIG
ncbi:MAG: protein translocase subunit SecD, partial [Melioribacteraceae bacterium]|nr:protein translocase subunit SecD [Melioribacteraceae bacterium]